MSDFASSARVSTQVHDLKQRSTKKVKDREEIDLNKKEDNIQMVANDSSGSTISQKISYKETLLSSPENAWEGNIVDVAEEDPNPEDRWYIDMEAQETKNKAFDPCPSIPVSKDEFDEWCKPWHAALVVKVLGKRVGLGFTEQRLTRDWVKKGKINIIDMDRDYFLEGQPEGSITGDLAIQRKCANQGVDCVDQAPPDFGPWMMERYDPGNKGTVNTNGPHNNEKENKRDINQSPKDGSRFNVLIDGGAVTAHDISQHDELPPKAPMQSGPPTSQAQTIVTKPIMAKERFLKKGASKNPQAINKGSTTRIGPILPKKGFKLKQKIIEKAPLAFDSFTVVVPQSKPSTSKDPYKEDMEQAIMENMRDMVKQQWEDFNATRNGNTSHGSNEDTSSLGIHRCAHRPDPEDRGKSVIVGSAPEKPPDATPSYVTGTTGTQKNSVNRVSKTDGADASDRV
ncbi:hypothetical protein Ahy_A07g033458 [Arachis hypogaea]|uniref:Uncharacterized protein n=1 Tax=Arachis hypogaea TaxID=3818 RepID=A0A445C9B4_ARAHY|nr:hypothetical protein Ahy_A07g033458 [Arachis hypogaea]